MIKRIVPAYIWLVALLAWTPFPPASDAWAADKAENPSIFPKRAVVSAGDTVDAAFATHLPLVVLEYDADVTADAPVDREFAMRLTLYDGAAEANSPGDAPAASIAVTALRTSDAPAAVSRSARRRTGKAAENRTAAGKYSYRLVLAESGSGAASGGISLAGLPAGGEWLLHGSTRDKSMMRNGLAYELGRVLFPDSTPATQFCEVLIRSGGAYRYEGIHILAQSPDSLNRALAGRGPDGILLEHIVGQERRGDDIVRVGSKFFTAIPARPDAPVTQDARRRISIELEKLESALYSVTPHGFLAYQSYLDEASAIDFFILNSLMLNALDSMPPFFLFRNRDGKFRFLPKWQFDSALDNAPERGKLLPFEVTMDKILPPSVLARKVPVWRVLENGGDIMDLRMYPVYGILNGDHYLWLDRLFMSRSFLGGLYARYHALRRGALSPDNVMAMTAGLSSRLGLAIQRDWTRWRKEYATAGNPYMLAPFMDDEGESNVRQTWSYDQDLVKIFRDLRKQDEFVLAQLETLNWMTDDLYDKRSSGDRQAAYALLTLVGMFILTHLLTRKL